MTFHCHDSCFAGATYIQIKYSAVIIILYLLFAIILLCDLSRKYLSDTMDTKFVDIFALIILNIVHCATTENILSCNVTSLRNCPKNQRCSETINECVCLEGYVRYGADCVEPNSESDTAADRDTTAAVVSIFTIVLIAVGLVLVIRKYNLIDYLQQKINSRRNNDVMYEDVMIGQDDPPLVP